MATFDGGGILDFAVQLAFPVVLVGGVGAVIAVRRGRPRLAWVLTAVVVLALTVAVLWTFSLS